MNTHYLSFKVMKSKYLNVLFPPRSVVFGLLAVFTASFAGAQIKWEREYRIKEREVPAKARDYIAALNIEDKIKWFREESTDEISLEAKTRMRNRPISLEFNLDGSLMDAELQIHQTDIPDKTRTAIDTYLKTRFEKHRIMRVQLQYSGNPEAVKTMLLQGTVQDGLVQKFEIEVRGRSSKNLELWEFLFSLEGKPEKESRIVLRNPDTLTY